MDIFLFSKIIKITKGVPTSNPEGPYARFYMNAFNVQIPIKISVGQVIANYHSEMPKIYCTLYRGSYYEDEYFQAVVYLH